MKLLLVFLFWIVLGQLQAQPEMVYQELLQKYVSDGKMNYNGFIEEKKAFELYLNHLSENPPQSNWSKDEKMAYWINAYNAFTIKLIIDNYPVESIRDLHPPIYIPGLNSVWHVSFFKIGGEAFDLDRIEHEILRKQFKDPRIHFAINCASKSCPPLRNEPYRAKDLNRQLEDQCGLFINDLNLNRLHDDPIQLSRIFSWFEGDFSAEGGVLDFINRYAHHPIDRNVRIDYMRYDWRLNE